MANKIQVRRGTKAQLTAKGALAIGEPGYCTDTGELYIGNGSGANTKVSVSEAERTAWNAKLTAASKTWIAPTLLNNWTNYGGTEDTAGYTKDSDGFVHIKGTVKLGYAAAVVYTLPPGYRPAKTLRFPLVAAEKFGAMTIDPSGGVFFNNDIDGTYVSMQIPPFLAEQ
ncbi:hypothetical protein [Paenibacillus donghaensis]|uniref:Major tropism determinant N-terminal domain-containing protein n=1 Tax=Paenibacillus donghaensis TaxID=414771 RepID=A0A2Z2KDP7_9BACL|nr:hypothetical protein [Paenibacillus donghaensis]ASA21945.1 hypothetical protein B9T62_14870 [Paenibacillus donghaensis]